MSGAKDNLGSATRPWVVQQGDPKVRVFTIDQEDQHSTLPPIEVKVNQGKSSQKLTISDYEGGTSRS